jgi:hypothetical protein
MQKSKSLSSSLNDIRKLSKNDRKLSFSALKLSPLRITTTTSLPSSPKRNKNKEKSNQDDGIINNFPRSMSSPRKRRDSFNGFLSNLRALSRSPVRSSTSSSSSTTNSLNSSPLRSKISSPISDFYYLKCSGCNVKKLEVNNNEQLILAIKCTCQPAKYFCSRHCHRCHFISDRCCEYFSFDDVDMKIHNPTKSKHINNLDIPITWEEEEFVQYTNEYIKNYLENKSLH